MYSTNNAIYIEIKEESLTKILAALKCLDTSEINYTLIESLPHTPTKDKIQPLGNIIQRKELGKKGVAIVELLSKGNTYQEIADELEITMDGVRYYVKKIYTLFNVKNSREAIHFYTENVKPYL